MFGKRVLVAESEVQRAEEVAQPGGVHAEAEVVAALEIFDGLGNRGSDPDQGGDGADEVESDEGGNGGESS